MIHIPKVKRDKLTEKAEEAIFVGYEANGYRLFNKRTMKIEAAKNVVFLNKINSNKSESIIAATVTTPEDDYIVPETYTEAMRSPETEDWQYAMDAEYDSLLENETWILKEPPVGRKIIKCKWVYNKKRGTEGNIVKYKARVVAKGYSQEDGIYYNEAFAPVARYSSIRLLLGIATQYNLNIRQMDAVTAFLNGKLEEEIWMDQIEGYEDGTSRKYKLVKSLYGLMQASRIWNLTINKVLLGLDLNRSIMDQCIYYKNTKNEMVIVALYVDDVLIFSSSKDAEERIVSELSKAFKMKDLGEASSILGIAIKRDKKVGTIGICQETHRQHVT